MIKANSIHNIKDFMRQVYLATILVCMVVSTLYLLLAPSYKSLIFPAVAIALTFSYLYFHYTGYSFRLFAKFYLLLYWVAIFAYGCVTGGLSAPGLPWLTLIPVISFITLTKKETKAWLAITLLTYLSFYLFGHILVIDSFGGDLHWNLISYMLLLIVTFYFVRSFHTILINKNFQLDELNKMLRENHNMLTRQNDEINEQYQIILDQNAKLEIEQENIKKRNERLETFLDQMLDIGRREEFYNGDLLYSIEIVQECLLAHLEVDRVSVWEYDQRDDQLKLINETFRKNFRERPDNYPLLRSDYPKYFEQLEAGVVLSIEDVLNNSSTSELHDYFLEYGFNALLDCPYFIDGKFAGVICCESLAFKKWCPEEVIFVRSMADELCLSFRATQRKKYQEDLKKQQKEIVKLNQQLEAKVQMRTQALKAKNEKLKDFAYMNSHKIRGPVCRLLGLKELLKLEANEINNPLHDHMMIVIEELNEITIEAGAMIEQSIEMDRNV